MEKTKLNQSWMFWKFGREDEKQEVNLPHDAMIHEKRDPETENGGATGFLPGGKYVYTKTLTGRPEDLEKTLILEYEGVYMDSAVFLNGEQVGGRLYGYSNFFVDITGKLRKGPNELKVIADNSATPNSRWYSGSGIYRDVNLWTGGSAHILPEGVQIKTVSTDPAVIEVKVQDGELQQAELRHTVLWKGTAVAAATGSTARITIPDAKLWSDKTPMLYTLKTELVKDNSVLDEAETVFGVRTLSWDAQNGFKVNGHTVKLRGGCIHHDHGILGACAYEKAEYRRVKKLKAMGFNAIRYSHNPAGKSFLKACDELGMYVIDESFDQWKVPQSAHDYAVHFDAEWQKDIASMVSKDYNHPSVVMYCVGNEITDTGLPFGAAICKGICAQFKALDDTRPTMIAINSMLSTLANLKARQSTDGKTEDVGSKEVNDLVALLPKIMSSITPESLEEIIGDCVKAVDIVGYNYSGNLYTGTHALAPDRVILSSETFPQQMAQNWFLVENNPYVIGDFHWTAWDYLGEAGVGLPTYGTNKAPFSKPYPCFTASCGSFDLSGDAESAAWYAATLWGSNHKPYIGVRPLNHAGEAYTLGNWRFSDSIPCWTWPGYEGKTAQVEVFSEGTEVELRYGDVVSCKPLADCRADFELPYAPGTLTATAYDAAGRELARTELRTAGPESRIVVEPEETVLHADGEDIVFVPVSLRDSSGTLKMTTSAEFSVTVEGPARLLAFGSAYPMAEPDYCTGSFAAWNGRALAVLQSTGEKGTVRVTVSAPGLQSGLSELTAE